MIKIHACTGWSLPSKEILAVFVDQFRKKILESYRYLNADEIEFAFRHYGSAAKDFGKNMNLAIIDEVIHAYLDEKNNIPKPISETLKNYE